MLIGDLRLNNSCGYNELSATIDGYSVWIRVPLDFPLVEGPEPFLAIGYLEALSRGAVVTVQSSIGVSEQLLANFEELNLIYCNWNRDFKPVTIECESAVARESRPGVATMYSGGVDSMFTLLRHERRITHMLRLFGYDFHDSAQDVKSIIAHDQKYAVELEKYYVPIETNFRQYMENRNIDPEAFWGFPLYAAGLAMGFETNLIPSSHSYSELFPASSHPMTDPLWGNGQVKFEHDILIRRSEKIERIVTNRNAMSNLHVCWKNAIENCGTCSKCIRTGVTLRLLGVETEIIPLSLAVEMLKTLKVTNESGLTFLEDNLILAQERQNKELEQVLLKTIKYHLRSQVTSQLDRVFLGGALRKLYRRWRKPSWLSAITLVQKESVY